MGDPTITCPNCHCHIPLTESLAAPLLAATRRDYERRIADKDMLRFARPQYTVMSSARTCALSRRVCGRESDGAREHRYLRRSGIAVFAISARSPFIV
jgi:hypothetical protein